MSYDLSIQPDDESGTRGDFTAIDAFLFDYPCMRRIDENQWVFEPDPTIHIEIDLIPLEKTILKAFDSIAVSIPYPFLAASREPALRLCFELAGRLNWRVYDEQLGSIGVFDTDYLEAPPPSMTWIDAWTTAAKQQSLWVWFAAMALAAVTYPYRIGPPVTVALFTTKIAFDAWRLEKR